MLSIVLSFVLASVWVSLATVAAERMGTKVGGIVSTLPSTLVVALFFIGVQGGSELAAGAAAVVPAEMGVNTIYLASFISLSHKGLTKALAGSLAIWAVLSTGIMLIEPDRLPISLMIFVALLTLSALWLRAKHRFEPVEGKHVRYTVKDIAFRGLFAGLLISIAVLLSAVSGPVLGGIFAVFPAIFTSTMVILYTQQGRGFTGATGSTMVIGTVNVVSYAVAVNLLFPVYGPVGGTGLALLASYLWSLGVYQLVNRYQD